MIKKFPYPFPQKVLKTEKDVKSYLSELVDNALSWLRIDGYTFYLLLPSDHTWSEDKEAGMSINVKYPYKSFSISVQASCIKDLINEPRDSICFQNVEKLVFHEVIHILFWHLSDLAQRRYVTAQDIRDAEETAVDHLANVITEAIRDLRKNKKL